MQVQQSEKNVFMYSRQVTIKLFTSSWDVLLNSSELEKACTHCPETDHPGPRGMV